LMRRRQVLAVLALLAALPSTVFFLAPLHPQTASQGGRHSTSLTVYQAGVAYVVQGLSPRFSQGVATLTLPGSAILETLRFEGVNVSSIRVRGARTGLLMKGDELTVRTESAMYRGIYEETLNGFLALRIGNTSVLIDTRSIVAIEVGRLVQAPSGNVTVELVAKGVDGVKDLNASYLARGITWSPSHFLQLGTAELESWAAVQSSGEWSNVTLTLVSGEPHIAFIGPVTLDRFGGAPVELARVSFSLGEYHAYRFTEPVTLEAGGRTVLPLLSGTVRVSEEYFWAGGPVAWYANVTNALSEPLATGVINFYSGREWVGSDSLSYTPSGGSSRLTVGNARDVVVSEKTIKIEHLTDVDRVTLQVTASNYKTETINLTLQRWIPYQATLVSADPAPAQEGQTLTWRITLSPGGIRAITYTYQMPAPKPV